MASLGTKKEKNNCKMRGKALRMPLKLVSFGFSLNSKKIPKYVYSALSKNACSNTKKLFPKSTIKLS